MKKKLHYRSFYKRDNGIKAFFIYLWIDFCSIPKTVLEVFFKHKMGERHFTKSLAIMWAAILFTVPFYFPGSSYLDWKGVLANQWFWYLFSLAFCVFSVKRLKESWRPSGEFDLSKYSRSHGFSHEFFFGIKWHGKEPSVRIVDIWYEPITALLAGLFMCLIGQATTGLFVIFCALCSFFNSIGAYMSGDDKVLDMIDEIIANNDRSESLNSGKPTQSGFKYIGGIPKSPDLRDELDKYLRDDEDEGGMVI